MRIKKPRPWLTSTGVEIPTDQLKEICKSWDRVTWDSYLKWYESALCARLLKPQVFNSICENLTESVFQEFDQNTDPQKRTLCERLLRTIPAGEAKVLRLIFFEGRTVREIAANEKMGKSTVHDKKNKALLRLRRGHDGDNPDTREFMRGVVSEVGSSDQLLWEQPLFLKIREDRVYDPRQFKKEFAKIKYMSLKMAITELSDREQRILYLHFWCDYSISEIARELRAGVNLIEQVVDAAISKLKRKIVCHETGSLPGEGPSCA